MNDRRDTPRRRVVGRTAAAGSALAVLALALVLTGPANALGIGEWGAEAGLSGGTQDFDYEGEELFDPNELLAGFTGGAYLDLGVGVVAPRVEVLYQIRGSKSEVPRRDDNGVVVGTATQEFRAQYLSVPVTMKLAKVGTGVTPYLAVGLGAEFLLGASSDSEVLFDQFDTVTLGGHILTGLEFTKVGIQIRFYRDLTNPYNPVEGDPLKEVHNQGYALLLTMKLGPG